MCPLPPTSSKVALGSRSATRRPCAWGASTSSSPCLRPSDNAIVPSRVSAGIADTGLAILPAPHFTAWRNGRAAPIFYDVGGQMEGVHTKERQLEHELTGPIEERVPGTEVLAVELLGPERFCIYIDHPEGVDHALCERVTRELDDYRREYTIDVSSPGLE